MQNRVNPFGNIISTPARGLWMGNRGKIHNDKKQIVRHFKLKAWLICKLEFNGRHRIVMGANTYTELFFLDEATAFEAGHRPCFECRRQDYNKFKSLWIKANPAFNFNDKTSMKEIDEVMHEERMTNNGTKKLHERNITALPNGSFISIDNKAYLISGKKMYGWSPVGYENPQAIQTNKKVKVVTPLSIIHTFNAGYKPQMKIGLSHHNI